MGYKTLAFARTWCNYLCSLGKTEKSEWASYKKRMCYIVRINTEDVNSLVRTWARWCGTPRRPAQAAGGCAAARHAATRRSPARAWARSSPATGDSREVWAVRCEQSSSGRRRKVKVVLAAAMVGWWRSLGRRCVGVVIEAETGETKGRPPWSIGRAKYSSGTYW